VQAGENARGVRSILGSDFSEKDKENDFPEIVKSFQKSHLKISSSKNCEINFGRLLKAKSMM
jgi:hypothetical protein